jgi:hypothetical protein
LIDKLVHRNEQLFVISADVGQQFANISKLTPTQTEFAAEMKKNIFFGS